MSLAKDTNIINTAVTDIISAECKQPYLRDETECCLTQYNGCCCNCKYQMGIYANFPVSSLYCYVCLFKISGQVFVNTTHGICTHYGDKNDTTAS